MMRNAHSPPWVMSLILHKYDVFILESIKIGIDIIVSERIENLKLQEKNRLFGIDSKCSWDWTIL